MLEKMILLILPYLVILFKLSVQICKRLFYI